eukprot:15436792-Alexandrium_andersonii.AAC.1
MDSSRSSPGTRPRRPNRSACERRAQAPLARARALQLLAAELANFGAHHGSQPTRMGAAVLRTLDEMRGGLEVAARP